MKRELNLHPSIITIILVISLTAIILTPQNSPLFSATLKPIQVPSNQCNDNDDCTGLCYSLPIDPDSIIEDSYYDVYECINGKCEHTFTQECGPDWFCNGNHLYKAGCNNVRGCIPPGSGLDCSTQCTFCTCKYNYEGVPYCGPPDP